MAKELVESMDIANVRMVYLEKIAQVNSQIALVFLPNLVLGFMKMIFVNCSKKTIKPKFLSLKISKIHFSISSLKKNHYLLFLDVYILGLWSSKVGFWSNNWILFTLPIFWCLNLNLNCIWTFSLYMRYSLELTIGRLYVQFLWVNFHSIL